jgi:hypothetical protein
LSCQETHFKERQTGEKKCKDDKNTSDIRKRQRGEKKKKKFDTTVHEIKAYDLV